MCIVLHVRRAHPFLQPLTITGKLADLASDVEAITVRDPSRAGAASVAQASQAPQRQGCGGVGEHADVQRFLSDGPACLHIWEGIHGGRGRHTWPGPKNTKTAGGAEGYQGQMPDFWRNNWESSVIVRVTTAKPQQPPSGVRGTNHPTHLASSNGMIEKVWRKAYKGCRMRCEQQASASGRAAPTSQNPVEGREVWTPLASIRPCHGGSRIPVIDAVWNVVLTLIIDKFTLNAERARAFIIIAEHSKNISGMTLHSVLSVNQRSNVPVARRREVPKMGRGEVLGNPHMQHMQPPPGVFKSNVYLAHLATFLPKFPRYTMAIYCAQSAVVSCLRPVEDPHFSLSVGAHPLSDLGGAACAAFAHSCPCVHFPTSDILGIIDSIERIERAFGVHDHVQLPRPHIHIWPRNGLTQGTPSYASSQHLFLRCDRPWKPVPGEAPSPKGEEVDEEYARHSALHSEKDVGGNVRSRCFDFTRDSVKYRAVVPTARPHYVTTARVRATADDFKLRTLRYIRLEKHRREHSMSMETSGGDGDGIPTKARSPYHCMREVPIPEGLSSAVQAEWIDTEITQDELDGYPFLPGTSVREKRGRTTYVGLVRNAMFWGESERQALPFVPGDVWVKTSSPVSVSVYSDDSGWKDWLGNDWDDLSNVSHPFLPQRCLWYTYPDFSWIKLSGLSSKKSQWRRHDHGAKRWMVQEGRVTEAGYLLQASLQDVVGLLVHSLEQKPVTSSGKDSRHPNKRRRIDDDPIMPAMVQPLEHTFVTNLNAGHGSGDPMADTSSIHVEVRSSLPCGPDEADISPSSNIQPPGDCSVGRFWDDLLELDRAQWPENAQSVTWRNGLKTVAPYAGITVGKEDIDVAAVKQMAEGWDAREGDAAGQSPIVFLKWDVHDSPSTLSDLRMRISEALSQNLTVVVEGWTFAGPPVLFDEDGFRQLRGGLDSGIQYICAKNRLLTRYGAETPAHVDAEVSDFVEFSTKAENCGNLMDSPQVSGAAPPFIEYVFVLHEGVCASQVIMSREISDDKWAWLVTAHDGYEEAGMELQYGIEDEVMEKVLKSHKQPSRKQLARMISAFRKKAIENARKAETDPPINKVGPRFASIDAHRFRHWDLMTTSGFYTFPHHDANGLCTWASVRDGCKIWAVARFKADKVASCTSLNKMMALFKNMTKGKLLSVVDAEEFELFVVVLERGSTIIMPPGTWHEVYTPVNTIITGGHFFTYDTFHLTQWSRTFDAKVTNASNADHVGVRRTLSRMTLALTYLRRPLSMRCFLALAALVLNEEEYTSKDADSEPPGVRYEDDIEAVMAYRIIKTVCNANGITRESVKSKSLLMGIGWQEQGTAMINLESAKALKPPGNGYKTAQSFSGNCRQSGFLAGAIAICNWFQIRIIQPLHACIRQEALPYIWRQPKILEKSLVYQPCCTLVDLSPIRKRAPRQLVKRRAYWVTVSLPRAIAQMCGLELGHRETQEYSQAGAHEGVLREMMQTAAVDKEKDIKVRRWRRGVVAVEVGETGLQYQGRWDSPAPQSAHHRHGCQRQCMQSSADRLLRGEMVQTWLAWNLESSERYGGSVRPVISNVSSWGSRTGAGGQTIASPDRDQIRDDKGEVRV
ncbi:hypothetical protein BV25DRAFT_1842471 [Artomyces pyxidatus]|uniref:Uncharacterized protein n=1 Tax=Artomyces pyxidatus TaxID=48021 RepID=A0ACB8SIW1_9AGAM|nr:hypothetical protein BV25DRAFT_1842471 [Artomyces pyxidatus]